MKKTIYTALFAALLCGAIVTPQVTADEPYNSPKRQVLRAARNGDTALKTLLSQGVDVNATDRDGETALMEAADSRNAEAVRVLIANGANVNAADEDGETALMIAADEGNTEAVRLLIQAGANVNARDEEGESALDKALDERNHQAAELLRAAGAR